MAPRLTGTSAPRSCAEAQLNERKSQTRSLAVMPKPVGGRIDVAEVLAIVQHHALRLRAGARGEQDHGVIVRPGGWYARRSAPCNAPDSSKKAFPASGPSQCPSRSRGADVVEEVVEPQAVLMQHERRA